LVDSKESKESKELTELELENELEMIQKQKDYPKNYGNRWTPSDKALLLELLGSNTLDPVDFNLIGQKLGRTEGGVKGEVKKMILEKYFGGDDVETISKFINLKYKFVKMTILSYIENEIDKDIGNLEKENKLLKLKLENKELRIKTKASLSIEK
jgi:hypothetical protein